MTVDSRTRESVGREPNESGGNVGSDYKIFNEEQEIWQPTSNSMELTESP